MRFSFRSSRNFPDKKLKLFIDLTSPNSLSANIALYHEHNLQFRTRNQDYLWILTKLSTNKGTCKENHIP